MESIDFNPLIEAKRIVIKIGSNLIVNSETNKIKKQKLLDFAREIKNLILLKKEVMLVSSGADALGKNIIKHDKSNIVLHEKQAAASVGQIILTNAWKEVFNTLDLNCGQILLTHNDAEIRKNAINARNTLEELIKVNAISIINENDTVATQELKYGDNDQLAARVAQISSANVLIILSDVKGLYNSNPVKNKNAKLIERVDEINKFVESAAKDTDSENSVGGMVTKVKAAKIALASGCHMAITNGNFNSPI